jgi:hypothetical protein
MALAPDMPITQPTRGTSLVKMTYSKTQFNGYFSDTRNSNVNKELLKSQPFCRLAGTRSFYERAIHVTFRLSWGLRPRLYDFDPLRGLRNLLPGPVQVPA